MGPQGLLFALRGYTGAVFHCRNDCRAATCRAEVGDAGKVGAVVQVRGSMRGTGWWHPGGDRRYSERSRVDFS